MNPFSKPIHEVTFQDIIDFCEQQNPETTTLDYKQSMPRDLAKHFATFSNTLGGVIIIGIEEDPKTGLPSKWEGVANDSKLIERVNQFAANVTPLPTFSVHATDEVNGNVFVLINILEGDVPPYHAKGDPTVWLRTGNTSTPLRQAERDELVRMVGKKEKAEKERADNLANAEMIFKAGIVQAEKQRQQLIADFEARGQSHTLSRRPYGEDITLLTVSLQPFYPGRVLVEPWQIKEALRDLQTSSKYGMHMPPIDMEPCPGGLFIMKQSAMNGSLHAYQLYANGLLQYIEDVKQSNTQRDKVIYLMHIASAFYRQMLFASKFYARFNYSGVISGSLNLTGAIDAQLEVIVPQSGIHFSTSDYTVHKISDYNWPLELDTNILHEETRRNKFFSDIMRKVYWDLGVETMHQQYIDEYLTDFNWQ